MKLVLYKLHFFQWSKKPKERVTENLPRQISWVIRKQCNHTVQKLQIAKVYTPAMHAILQIQTVCHFIKQRKKAFFFSYIWTLRRPKKIKWHKLQIYKLGYKLIIHSTSIPLWRGIKGMQAYKSDQLPDQWSYSTLVTFTVLLYQECIRIYNGFPTSSNTWVREKTTSRAG